MKGGNLKKLGIIILSLIILLLSMSCISAGLLDGFFGDDPKESDSNNVTFLDIGTSKNCSSEWLVLKNVSKTVTEKGTIISTSDDKGAYANKPGTSLNWDDTFEWSSPFTIEFDILDYNGSPFIRIKDDSTDATKGFDELGINNGSHVKIVSNDNGISYIVDGKNVESRSGKFTDAQIGFRLIDATVEYKNFKIY